MSTSLFHVITSAQPFKPHIRGVLSTFQGRTMQASRRHTAHSPNPTSRSYSRCHQHLRFITPASEQLQQYIQHHFQSSVHYNYCSGRSGCIRDSYDSSQTRCANVCSTVRNSAQTYPSPSNLTSINYMVNLLVLHGPPQAAPTVGRALCATPDVATIRNKLIMT